MQRDEALFVSRDITQLTVKSKRKAFSFTVQSKKESFPEKQSV